jgi:hypothetical protein
MNELRTLQATCLPGRGTLRPLRRRVVRANVDGIARERDRRAGTNHD